MAKAVYIGNNNSKKVKKIYLGNGTSHKVKKGYIGVDGASKLFFSGSSVWGKYNTITTTTHYWNRYNVGTVTRRTWERYSINTQYVWDRKQKLGYGYYLSGNSNNLIHRYPDTLNYGINLKYYKDPDDNSRSSAVFDDEVSDENWTNDLSPLYQELVGKFYISGSRIYEITAVDTIYGGNVPRIEMTGHRCFVDEDTVIYDNNNFISAISSDPDAYPNGGELNGYYYDNRREEKIKGTLIDTITSTVNNQYPTDGISGDYWYVLDESKTETENVQGTIQYSDSSSTNRNRYPNNGQSGNYWYVYDRQDISYSRGSYIGDVESDNPSAYPTNGRHTDGYWYVKQSD